MKSFIVAGALVVSANAAAATVWLSENVEAFQDIYIAKPASEHPMPNLSLSEFEWGLLVEDLLGRNFDVGCKFNGFDGYDARCVKAGPYRAVLATSSTSMTSGRRSSCLLIRPFRNQGLELSLATG
jgi:hypothetical protein